MNKWLMGIVVIAGVVVISGPALAKQDHTNNSGGQSAEHMSEKGVANTNGATAADRDKGRARAEERASEQAQPGGKPLKHEKKPHGKEQ